MTEASQTAPTTPPSPPSGRPTLTDWVFLSSMVVMIALVAWVGELSYHEGMKTEVSKRNGEAWAQWFVETGAERFKDDFGLLACAGGPTKSAPATDTNVSPSEEKPVDAAVTSPSPTVAPSRSWGECLQALTTPPGSLAGLRNPFINEPLQIAAKCEPNDRSLIGALVLEKLVPTPPGSTIPFVTSPLTESDLIDAKLQVRVTVCDKGAYPIRVAEVEF